MVRSTSSCFKIITCSSDSIEDDDLEQVEKKGTTDKRRWSFRKGSDRHQVISNTVMLEALPTGNKENSESPSIDFKAQTSPAVPEKTSESHQTDELKPASHAVSSKALSALMATENTSKGEALISTENDITSDTFSASENTSKSNALSTTENTSKGNAVSATENTSKGDALIATESSAIMDSAVKFDAKLEEYVAIVIQAAIRGYLSQRALLKLKNVIKLQAAFRGHLQRRQAVGTLRCVQAIIKMQALVRARRARMFIEGPVTKEKLDEEHESNDQSGKPLVRGGMPGADVKSKFSSTEKLLGNGFAQKLLETVPKKKPIRIKCDPLRPDSAWKWLERWVSASSSDFAQPHKAQPIAKNDEYEERKDRSASGLKDEIPTEIMSESIDSKSIVGETEVEDEKNLITYDEDKFDFQYCPQASSTVTDDPEKPLSGSGDALSEVQETTSDVNHHQSDLQLDSAPKKMLDSILGRPPKTDSDQPTHSMTEVASESVTESKKVGFVSRKVSNPAFVAAQSKFEELSSTSPTGRSIISTYHDTGIEMNLENVSPSADSRASMKLTPTDNSVSDDQNIHAGSVEFGAGVPVPSMLDLPETSEVVGEQKKHDSEEAKEAVSGLNVTTENASNLGHLDDVAKQECPSSQTSPSYSASDKLEKPGVYDVDSTYANGEAIDSALANGTSVDSTCANGKVVTSDYADGKAVDAVYGNGGTVDSVNLQVGKETERSVSDLQTQLDTTENPQTYNSPDGSPRTHITIPESNQTPPSTKSSVESKKKKLSKKERKQNRKSWSEGKKSPSNPTPESAGRKSTEQTPKDMTNGRRRISFGVMKLEHGNQESGDNNSSSSLPSYMQATESARAKANASSSPKSSPDVQDSEHVKKRHSLPNTNGKQVSPRMQSSTPPQVQHGSKGKRTNTSRERWQR